MTIVTELAMVEEVAPSTRPTIRVVESTENYGKVVVEPLERGFGVTLGNAMRRVLLSSLPGAAITGVRIDGVQHEYSTIPSVKEDVAEILLNVKAIRIKPLSDRPGPIRLEVQGPGQVTAGDIQPSADFEIVNPELYLASLDSSEAKLSAEFNVEIGKGYVPAAHTDGQPIGVLPVDAIFTPVRRVNYTVEKTRVGQVTNYDRLVLELWTDGTKSPREAVRESGQILVDSFFQFVSLDQAPEGATDRQPLAHTVPAEQYNIPIERLELSARTLNCLKRAKINKVGEVLEKSHDELLKIKNFGDKSLAELYDRLRAMGLLSKIEGAEAKLEAAQAKAAKADKPEKPEPVAVVRSGPPTAAELAQEAEMGSPARQERERARAKDTIRDLAGLKALIGEEVPAPPQPAATVVERKPAKAPRPRRPEPETKDGGGDASPA